MGQKTKKKKCQHIPDCFKHRPELCISFRMFLRDMFFPIIPSKVSLRSVKQNYTMKYLCRINYRVEVYTTCSWDIAVKHHTIFQFASIETRHSVTFWGKWSFISMLQDFLGEFWLLQRWNVNLIPQSIFTLSFNLCTITPVHIFPTLFSTYFLWH